MRLLFTATAVAVAGFLAACGGGGSDDNESAAEIAQKSPAGLYTGTTGSGSTLREVAFLVLDTAASTRSTQGRQAQLPNTLLASLLAMVQRAGTTSPQQRRGISTLKKVKSLSCL